MSNERPKGEAKPVVKPLSIGTAIVVCAFFSFLFYIIYNFFSYVFYGG